MISASIENRRSWHIALLALGILSVSFGSPLLVVVGMKQIQSAMDTDRAVLSMASALVWIGNGVGGILMGWLADRVGLRRVVALGVVATASGLALSSVGSVWALYVGHGLLMGFLGNGALYAPLMVYVSRWFDRRRGTALALIASGQYVAGIIWPAPLEMGITRFGWQTTMLAFGGIVLALLPLLVLLRPAPEPLSAGPAISGSVTNGTVLGFRPNTAMTVICIASFFCCVPMALPASHLVAFCGDIGIPTGHGAIMLSVMLGCAFVSRQAWGAFADRFGGLRSVMAGSAFQTVAIGAFLLTRNEAGLFAVAATFGLGFSGIIPAYSVTIRDLYPSREASWRIPTVLFTAMSGMAFGSWFAGRIYDLALSYRPAFGIGVACNAMNLVLIGFLLSRMATDRRGRRFSPIRAAE
jgi:MFS family permease